MQQHRIKIILSAPHIIEVYEYEYPVRTGQDHRGRKKTKKGESENKDKNKIQTIQRARNNIRRLALANFSENAKFITLTFKDTDKFNIRSVKECNIRFNKFIKRCRRVYGCFKYLAVVEFQDKNKRGAVHYHMLSDIAINEVHELAKLWLYGEPQALDIQPVECINDVNIDNIGAYLIKYMSKNLNDERFAGSRCYLKSRNLVKPVELTGAAARKYIYQLQLKDKNMNPVYTNTYKSEYNGEVTYKEYNLKRKL